MAAYVLCSLGERVRSQSPLQMFALNCCVSETLSEVVLRAVSAAVASVTDNGDYQLLVLFVVREDPLEAIAQVVEVDVLGNLRLKDARLDVSGGHRTRWLVVNAETASGIRLEEVLSLGAGLQNVEGWWVLLHAGLRGTSGLGSMLKATS